MGARQALKALDHIAHLPRGATLSDVDGTVVKEDAGSRYVLLALTPRPGVTPGSLEIGAWRFGLSAAAKASSDDRVRCVESYLYRCPTPWVAPAPHGDVVVKDGTWLAGFQLSDAAWAAYKSGDLGPKALLRLARPNNRKDHDMGKKDLRKELRSHNFAGTFAIFDERVARAEADFAKAKAADEPYAIAVAKSELHISRQQRTLMKMIAAENARERDPQMAIRSARGQGVPLISNRHQLGDDPSLRGV